ncbi:MAG: DUF475 domain-containing protein [Candidatus Gastranaerophilales bacterium]|nr:DUF475 domain-containing protein [Candidatus Gastranaerophilales bacterium]
MFKYFYESFFVTIVGFILAFLWGEHLKPGGGALALFIVGFLAILEITLSFDNAVVNAMKLEKMSKKWQHRFLTWGILIAVFGMRFLFPVVVVACFAHISLLEVTKLALYNVDKYAYYLHIVHAPLVTFGGAFLMMLCMAYFFNKDKTTHWICWLERPILQCNHIKYVDIIFTLLAIIITQAIVPVEQKLPVTIAGLVGVILYLVIDSVSNALECYAEKKAALTGSLAKLGFIGFLYLELIDASFSLDGVLGAFAISKDIVIITIGLAIGAMFVRSLTLFMVDMKTLQKYCYLEHGAHWAIGFLALIMFYSTVHEVPEVITGGIGLVIVSAAFISSVKRNKSITNDD